MTRKRAPLDQRFWRYVQPSGDGCWHWQGAVNEHGYGVIGRAGRAVRAITATEAGELLPRGFAQADHFECRFCSYAERCWGGAA